jgi:hypothetical protein
MNDDGLRNLRVRLPSSGFLKIRERTAKGAKIAKKKQEF